MKQQTTLSIPAKIAASHINQSINYKTNYFFAAAFGLLAAAGLALGIVGQKYFYAISAAWALFSLAWCMKGAYTEVIKKKYMDYENDPID